MNRTRSIEIDLPFPPSVNRYWRYARGRYYVSPKVKKFWEAVVAAACCDEPFSGDVGVDVEVYPPDRRRRDVDNLLKSILDGLQYAGVYRDDSQVAMIRIVRREVMSMGRCVVRVFEIPRGCDTICGTRL